MSCPGAARRAFPPHAEKGPSVIRRIHAMPDIDGQPLPRRVSVIIQVLPLAPGAPPGEAGERGAEVPGLIQSRYIPELYDGRRGSNAETPLGSSEFCAMALCLIEKAA